MWTQLRPSPGRSGRQAGPRLVTVATWSAAGSVALYALVRIFGLDRGALLVQAVSFTPYAALAAILSAGAAAFLRRWWPAAMAGVAAIALVVVIVPRAVGSPTDEAGVPLTLMSMNMLLGQADAASIVDLVRSRQVDVLAVQELTAPAVARLDAAGLGDLLPYRAEHPGSRSGGSALYSRYPLTDTGVATPGGYRQAYALVQVPQATAIRIESVHPLPPIDSDDTSRWVDGLREQVPASAGGILAGDFNATLDHTELRRLIATGYRDAAAEVGEGLTPTWPFHGKRSWVTPRITLDHVLVPDGVAVRGFEAVTIPHSDHRAIVATLTLRPPSR